MTIAATLRDRLGLDLADVAGARLSGELPASDDLVNRLIAQKLGQHAQIAAVRLQARDGDAIAVEIVTRTRIVPMLRLAVRIERQPDLPHDPRLVLRWSMPALGPLAMFASPVLAFFKATPPGIRVEGDRIDVDLGELLRTRGMSDVLDFLRRLEIHTRAGGFVVRFEAGV